MKHGDSVLHGGHSVYLAQLEAHVEQVNARRQSKLRLDRQADPPSLTVVVVTSMLAGGMWALLIRAIIAEGW